MSKIKLADAVSGTEVILTSTKYGDYKSNPVYSGSQGKVKGKIERVTSSYIVVRWENNSFNYYDGDSLEAAPVVATVPVPVAIPAPTVVIAAKPLPVSVTLENAVIKVVNEQFIDKNLDFSAYDVTSKVRREINENRFEITGKTFEDINGMTTQRINHDEVRVIVRAIMNSKLSYTRTFNGGYTLYKYTGVPAAVATVLSTPSVTHTPTGVQYVGTPILGTSDFATKLQIYIGKKGTPTLKQIQSRFKVEGADQITVRDIATKSAALGFKVEVKTPYYSSVVSK